MFSSIILKFTENGDLKLPASGITIFVGPNNSGKSLVLRELERAGSENPFPHDLHVLKDYEIAWPSQKQLQADIKKFDAFRRPTTTPGNVVFGRIYPNGGLQTQEVDRQTLLQQLTLKPRDWWASTVLRWGLIRLDGRSRFNLTNDQPGGDLLSLPGNVLAHLFQDEAARKKVRSLVKEAFQLHFVIDPTNLGQLRIRLSTETPPADEQSLNKDARDFYSRATHIKDASDGVQAFTGIVTAALSGEFHTILIDEPEAFLHPPLARKLGSNLASLVAQRGGALMASTHSPDFLMGCVQATKDVRVVRMEYANGKSRGKMVDPSQLEAMFKRPLMRSANIVSGLFHDGVIVTESDNDRAFYGEIYARLAAENPDYPSILFVNAQNKQTIREMMGPLRKFGVPTAAIPDVDILKDGGKTWTDWLEAAQLPKALHVGFGQQRSAIKDAFAKANVDMKVGGGVTGLDPSSRAAADQLFDSLDDYGIFSVREGELETWLKHLAVPGKKTDWTVGMLERLGSEPTDLNYVKPAQDDVWKFMRAIVAWIRNPARKGTS